MSVFHWAEIEAFHNLRKHVGRVPAYGDPDLLHGNNAVDYMAKVKLHGTNSAIQIHSDGRVIAQSRTAELINGNDNYGFAKWVKEQEVEWALSFNNIIFFGEWCGNGIQKGVAISEIGKKVFAIFAARYLDGSDDLIIHPNELHALFNPTQLKNIYILPWHEVTINKMSGSFQEPLGIRIDWRKPDQELASIVTEINKYVLEVEQNDPWVEATFGVKGVGEGLVFYPISKEHLGVENFANLAFKAKGEAHRVTKQALPVQVSAQVATNIDQFIDLVLSEARLQQGVSMVSENNQADMKLTGKFMAWVWADVQKENQDELDASQLEWKQVQKPLSDKARAWYLAKAKS